MVCVKRRSKPRRDVTAIIYDKRGKILSIGKNSYIKTHPLQAHHAKRVGLEKQIFLHAEIDAIVKCKNLSKAYRILVIRRSTSGEPLNAKPCKICADAISKTPIQIIDHT